eukprot:jgi/Picre1/27444/NNA_000411.t1
MIQQTMSTAMRGTALKVQTQNNKAPRGMALKTLALFKKNEAPAKTGKGKGVKVALGFTKSNELFVGRMAMLGIASSIIGELLTGKGAIAQLGLETGLSLTDVDGFILGLIGFNLVAALLPTKGKFVADEDELEDRPEGVLQDPSISVLDWRRFFGIKGFGFTKENELFVGPYGPAWICHLFDWRGFDRKGNPCSV